MTVAQNIGKSARSSVLVTGGAGYIGSHVVLALTDAGWPVVVVDDLSAGDRRLVSKQAAFERGDIADEALVARVIEEHDVGAIMHFAGSIVVPESVANPLKYYLDNTAKSRTLIATAVGGGVKCFIFSSSAAVYGIPQEIPVVEDAPLAPISPYGCSKLMTEMMLRDVAAAHDFDYCALRYFNVAGADPDGRSGQCGVRSTHLIKVAVETASGRRPFVSVFGDDYPTPDGTGVRDYIHVSDLAAAHVQALELLTRSPGQSHTLNCGYGRGFSVMEVLASVERVVGKAVPWRPAPRRAGDPARLIADVAKIGEVLGWKPAHDDIDTIVRHALAWEVAGRLGPPSAPQGVG
jgi:UDP-glucose 4-epimerase